MLEHGTEPAERERADRLAVRVALAYALVGATWIVATDLLLGAIARERAAVWIETLRGVLFLFGSAVLVFWVIHRSARRSRRADAHVAEAQAALLRTEERYRTLVESVPAVTYINAVEPGDDLRTTCVYISPQLTELLGYEPAEWIQDDELWQRVIHPDDRDRVLKINAECRPGDRFRADFRATTRDGRIVWLHDEAVYVAGSARHPAYWQGVMIDVTAQRMQDEALYELTGSLRGVFDASPLAIIVIEVDGRVRHWNPAAERMFGWTAKEIVGRPLPYLPADKRQEFEELVRRELAGESIAGFETRRIRKDGTSIDVSLSIAALRDADGRVTAMVGVVDDITERRRVAAELANRERQQEAVAELGLASLQGGDLPSLMNEAAELVATTLGLELTAVFELPPEEDVLVLRARTGWPGDIERSPRIDAHRLTLATYALRAGEAVIVEDLRSEERFPRSQVLLDLGVTSGVATAVSGGTGPLGVLEALSARPRAFTRDDVRFLQGVAAILGLAIERDRASSALATAEAKHRGLVERGPGVVYLTDPVAIPSAVTYVSPQVVDMLGYPAEDWTDDPRFWTTILHPEDRDRLLRAEARSIETGEPLDVEYRFVAADGAQVWVHDKATVVAAPDGTPVVRQGLFVDVTGRRRADEERRRALDRQLRLATRLELLHQVDRDVLSARSIEDMAGGALEHLRHLVSFDRGSVGLIDADTGEFTYVAVRHSPAMGPVPPSRSHVPDSVARALLSRTVLLFPDLEDADDDTPYVAMARAMGIRSLLSVALFADEGQLGVLILSSLVADAFDEEAIDIAKEVGSELAIAIRQTRLREALGERAEQLERLAEERQQMLHRIVRAQEEERERVALELHDGLGQVLTSVSLFASDLENEVPPESRPRAVRVNELVRRAIVDSRQLVWSLRPPELERLGLVPALRRLAEEVSIPELTVDLHEEIGGLRLAPEAEAVVYRVVQEAVHNAQKHACASAISILLHRQDEAVAALVEDNGRGFDPAAVPTGRGLGLIGMRERAELVTGELVVESSVGAGTRIRLEVPITEMERG